MKRLLQVCFIAAMVFGLASCTKDDNNTNGGNGTAETPTSLVGTKWTYNDGEAQIIVNFQTDSLVEVNVDTPYGPERYPGTYTYSNGNGTMYLYINGDMQEIRFTVNGNTMNAYGTPSGDVVLTRMGSNPQPGPNPGGDVSNSLVGTSWMWTDYDDIVAVEFFDASQVYIIVGDYGDDDQSTFIGTYTYSNGNGAISVYIEGQHYNITFTVNGNTLTAYNTPGGTITFTRMGSNPNPGPNPGGDVSNSLVGTGWMWTDYDDIVVVEFGDNGQVGIMVGDYGDDNQSTFMGTYTYSNGNGTISVYVEGQHYNITFTVNGNTLTAYNTPGGTITMTREYK